MAADKSWDGDINKLPKDYLSIVKQMVDKRDIAGVRFGITGKGVHPNYELIYIDGSRQPMSGQNHQKFRDFEEFDVTNITNIFTLDELKAAQFTLPG
jgi:outer membrane receptor for ferrienterochelin and colicin